MPTRKAAGPASARKSTASPLRPIARVERISLFEREVRERLSNAALDLLLARAEIISEGQRSIRGGKDGYFGSTMLTINLDSFSSVLRDVCDAGTAKRTAVLLGTDPTLPTRVKAIATHELTRLQGARPRHLSAEVKVRARGARVYIDVDLEAGF